MKLYPVVLMGISLIQYGEDIMATTGEKPGKGAYYCEKCGQRVDLDDHTDTLPPCPKCAHTKYKKG
ncbi:hypothetical protein HPQ32_09770 [Photobacterium carnosum]|uniref:zinc ribbon-containing protein n=1 Tax=Photobacterium carnosum TaxID=2023717 RepID=UPI00128D0B3E|nr:hypothetical protein [Photobacterium carnosum]MBY3788723.1 hypothetical protein [Photobacterium carnosum]MCD9526614.1 hypothetical protein [Photobacterium carnosum]MCD9533883.1 hypothetical protein [Photobacterium carnosum]MCD9555863.1 hypothetical protein [Photobacterium carnosum]